MERTMERETFQSRLGFILISAGCAIGIGNVWRFPYVAGTYGGAVFVGFYMFFLLVLGIPVMTMEFSVGRASKKSSACAFKELEKPGSKWHLHGYMAVAGNYLLMMFYTTVAGWMLSYFAGMVTGRFAGADTEKVNALFQEMLAAPLPQIGWMLLVVLLGFGVCSLGLQQGVERITKWLMLALLAVMVVLAFNSLTLEGGEKGLAFYLRPDFNKVAEIGWVRTIVEAMNQAFFTLSLGIGSMAIFGSYLSRERSLFGESVQIAVLDTFVALISGLIIFPACFAFGVKPDSGPSLIFITLPNIFNSMAGGRIWGSLFFVFMSFAALSTVIAVFENIMSFGMDLWGWSRKKTALINFLIVGIGSLPCVLGFNLLSGFQPLGAGSSILDLEDFLVSTIFLPFGSLIYVLFCVSRYGWGFDNYMKEANAGSGLKLPRGLRIYLTFVLPVIILGILLYGLFIA